MKTTSKAVIVLANMTVVMTFLFIYYVYRMEYLQPSGSMGKGKIHGTDRAVTGKIKVATSSKHAESMGENENNCVIAAAMRISDGGERTLLVTLVNDAFLPFAFSWLCNTRSMGIHGQVLFITGENESAKKIQEKWPEVSAVQLEGINSGSQEYSHVGYVELMVRRSEIIMEILEKNITIFLFEVDCLWFRNPLKNLESHRGVDIVVNAVSEKSKVIAGGFLYVHPTGASKRMWRALTKRLTNLGEKIQLSPDTMFIDEMENDQIYLSQLVFSKHGGLTYKVLPTTDYADGKWYKLSEEQRNKLKPYLVNNNWVRGNPAKIKRAKKWGHWFLTDRDVCDWKRVQKVVGLQ